MKTKLTESIEEAAEYLRKGELVAFPTETVYGLGALINDESALKKIYEAKGRPQDNPLIVHICEVKQLYELVSEVNSKAFDLIQNFWPGPLTLIFNKKAIVGELESENSVACSQILSAGLPTIALRLPANETARKLIEIAGVPIAAPSANLSGKPSATSYKHVLEDFDGLISCVLKDTDTSSPAKGLESTVIDCTSEPFRVLRLGSIELEELEKIMPLDLSALKGKTDKPASPGMKYRHYAPKAKVVLLEGSNNEDFAKTEISSEKRDDKEQPSAYIGLTTPPNELFEKVCLCNSLKVYAENLFAFFRECDNENIKTVYCEMPPPDGLGRTIIDRLQKAAAPI